MQTEDLGILYLSIFLTRIGFGAIVIIFPAYLKVDSFTAGVVLALYPLLEAGSALPVGRYLDKGSRRKPFLFGLFLMACLTTSIGLTLDVTLVAIAHAIMGFAAATITIGSLTMITDLTKTSNRGGGMGIFDFANIAGYVVGALLGGRLERHFEDHPGYPFLVIGGLIFVIAVLSLSLLKEPEHPKSDRPFSINPFEGLDQHTKSLFPIWLGLTIVLGLLFFLPKIFPTGELAETNGFVFAAAGLVALGIGATGFGRLSDRVGRTRITIIGVLGQIGLLGSLGLTYPHWSDNYALIGVFAFLSTALVPSVLATVGDRARGDMRGSALGLYSMMLSIGLAIGNIIGGFIGQTSGVSELFLTGFAIFSVACVVSLVLNLAKGVS